MHLYVTKTRKYVSKGEIVGIIVDIWWMVDNGGKKKQNCPFPFFSEEEFGCRNECLSV